MNKLSLIGRFFTPVAMVVFLAYEIVRSQNVTGMWYYAVLLGAVTTAVGFEVVGILSGHAVEGFSRTGNKSRLVVSLMLLAVYTLSGVFIFAWQKNYILVVIPIVSTIVYLVAALVEGLEEETMQASQETAVRTAFEMEQEAADREIERQLKAQKQADGTAVKLARIEAKTTSNRSNSAVTNPVTSGYLPSDYRLLTDDQKGEIESLTSGELAQKAQISDSTARRWKRKVAANGYHK